MVAFEQRLRLDYIDGRAWVLVEPLWFVYEDATESYDGQVPAMFVTDFHSVPRLLWRVLPPTEYGHAAVIHDYLYRLSILPRGSCDRVYLEVLERLGAPRWKRRVMHLGVRIGGWKAYGKTRARAEV